MNRWQNKKDGGIWICIADKASLCNTKTLRGSFWASCCSSLSHIFASGFAGKCFMRSARSEQGVAVVGACKEKGGSFPLPPSLPLDPSLFCSPCSTCLSLLSLTACYQHSFRAILLRSDSLYSQSALSKRAASGVQFVCASCVHVCKCRSLFLLTFCTDCRHVETWLNIRR